MTMITPSYLGETIEYSSLHACRSTLEDPTAGVRADELRAQQVEDRHIDRRAAAVPDHIGRESAHRAHAQRNVAPRGNREGAEVKRLGQWHIASPDVDSIYGIRHRYGDLCSADLE